MPLFARNVFVTSEKERLEAVAQWHTTFDGFESKLLHFNYLAIEPHFVGSSCMELGPADGQMTGSLLDKFANVTSVEGSEKYFVELRDRYGDRSNYSVVHSLFEDYKPNDSFDTVIAVDVFEHLDDPQSVLEAMLSWVSPTGRMIVLVPNAMSIHRRLGVEMGLLGDVHDLNDRDIALGHRRVYDAALLRSHVESAGWSVATSGGSYLKAMSNVQSEEWLSNEMIEGYFALGKQFPDIAATIFVVCTAP